MPFGHWKNFDACLSQMEGSEGYSSESAHKVCGKLKSNLEKSTHPQNFTVKERHGSNRTSTSIKEHSEGKLHTYPRPLSKDAQTKDQPHPRLDLEPSDRPSKRSQRMYDGQGMPRDVRRVEKVLSNFKRTWRDHISKPDMEKVPEKIKEKLDSEVKKECSCEGQKVEMEHSDTLRSLGVPEDKIPEAAKKIAADHVKEDPEYYKHLKEMEEKFAKDELPRAKKKDPLKNFLTGKTNNPPVPQYESDTKPVDKAMTAGSTSTSGSAMMHAVADGVKNKPGDIKDCEDCKVIPSQVKIKKADEEQVDEDSEIRQLRLKSKLSPTVRDLKELTVQKDSVLDWDLDFEAMLKSDRDFSGTFHKPVVDKENDIIPASAMDKAMDDFMVLPTLQEVHTERTVGIITKAWKTSEDEYKFEGKIKPGDDCNDVWDKIKKGEYDGLSIGGRRIKYSKDCSIPSAIRDTPCVTHKLKLYNVSVCSSPVNPEASVDEVNKVAKGGNDLTKGDNMDEVETYDDVITKSDISELTKAIDDLTKSFASHFARLTTPQPQKLGGGHAKKVTNTLRKDEDEGETPDIQKDMDEPEMDVRKSEDIQKAYDAKIMELTERISKMENEKIVKGGTAVIIPEQVAKDDQILSNTSMFNGYGRMAK